MMLVAVSACLLGYDVKYNGKNNRNELLLDFLKDKEVIAVCPESILPRPRRPVEWLNGKAVTDDGVDVTSEFTKGADIAMKKIMKYQPDLVILQARSPSCGVNFIYDGTFTKHLIPGHGDLAALVLKAGYQVQKEQMDKEFVILKKKDA
jgi:uncharacterized protein YbbK (DUF523 family)